MYCIAAGLLYICGTMIAYENKLLEHGTLEWLTNHVFILMCISLGGIILLLVLHNMNRDELDDLEHRVSKLEEDENGED